MTPGALFTILGFFIWLLYKAYRNSRATVVTGFVCAAIIIVSGLIGGFLEENIPFNLPVFIIISVIFRLIIPVAGVIFGVYCGYRCELNDRERVRRIALWVKKYHAPTESALEAERSKFRPKVQKEGDSDRDILLRTYYCYKIREEYTKRYGNCSKDPAELFDLDFIKD